MKKTQTIKDFYGRIIGFIEVDTKTGDKTVKDFYNRILGYYDAQTDTTKDFYRRVIAQGDMAASLLKQDK